MENINFYLEKLKKNTSNNKISWRKLNEGTFVWQTNTSNNVKVNVILQKAISFTNSFNILFRLFEVDSKRILMDINTRDTNPQTLMAITDLFNTIENSHSNNKLNILDDLLKDFD